MSRDPNDEFTSSPPPSAAAGAHVGVTDHSFLGQPKQLATLFSVEAWERFSFYGMQIILVYYLYFSTTEGGLGIDQGVATGIVGAYGGCVYLSTILGAWLADRIMGAERTLFYAAVLVMLGHIALSALPGLLGVGVGLILIALGSGGVKANCTSLVGTLYAPGDPKRDAGFSIYYLGINLGAFAGPLLTGWLQTTVGFHAGFLAAAAGMAIGLTTYALGRKNLPDDANEIPNPLPADKRTAVAIAGVVVVGVVVLAAVTGVLTADNLSVAVVLVTIVATIAYFVVILGSRRISGVERKRVVAFIPLFLVSAVFWSLYQQQFTVLAVYADQQLNRTVFGWEMPASWVQSINPVFIILLSGVYATAWTKLGQRQPSSPVKFALGTAVMGIAFLLFIPMASSVPNSAPLLGVVGVIFVFTNAELLISPISLSLSTKLAPKIFETQMVALLFLSIALGTAMAGVLSQYYSVDTQVAYFGILGAVAVVVGVALWSARTPILRLMSGVK